MWLIITWSKNFVRLELASNQNANFVVKMFKSLEYYEYWDIQLLSIINFLNIFGRSNIWLQERNRALFSIVCCVVLSRYR